MGYLVVAPDLVARGNRALCLARTMTALRRGRGRTFDDLDGARATLAGDPRCTGDIGVIGFCMGGGFALLLAGRPGWDVAVANYGVVPDAEVLDGACPVVASYGGRDLYLRGAARRLRTTLADAGVPHDVEEYPAAGHGFLNALEHDAVVGPADGAARHAGRARAGVRAARVGPHRGVPRDPPAAPA